MKRARTASCHLEGTLSNNESGRLPKRDSALVGELAHYSAASARLSSVTGSRT